MEPTTSSRAAGDPALRAAALHDRLTTIVLDGGGVADVAAALSEVVGAGVLVLDRDHRVLAEAGGGADTTG
ncbi:MAG TPA: diguanylate phosphodiesterase, partial [Streptomyces sp.]